MGEDNDKSNWNKTKYIWNILRKQWVFGKLFTGKIGICYSINVLLYEISISWFQERHH